MTTVFTAYPQHYGRSHRYNLVYRTRLLKSVRLATPLASPDLSKFSLAHILTFRLRSQAHELPRTSRCGPCGDVPGHEARRTRPSYASAVADEAMAGPGDHAAASRARIVPRHAACTNAGGARHTRSSRREHHDLCSDAVGVPPPQRPEYSRRVGRQHRAAHGRRRVVANLHRIVRARELASCAG